MSDASEERAIVAAALPDRAPFEEAAIELPGRPRVFAGRGVLAWVASPGRVRAELAGLARVPLDHPARPIALHADGVLAFEAFAPIEDPIAAVRAWPRGEARELEGTRRELLGALGAGTNLPRAMGKLLPRRELDRWLNERVRARVEIGASFGGVHPGWLREQEGRAVCLRCDRAGEGWRTLDLAGLSLDPSIDLDVLREEEGGAALDLALAAVWTREIARYHDEAMLPRLRALIAREPEPERVRVTIEGPAFVDPRLWIEGGAEVPASRARWLLAHLDGLAVGGGRLRVRTDPPIRAGKRAPVREDRRARRRRLFSRWDEGVRADDEGLLSATPEALALRIARGARGVVIDGTCGIGALAIAYARQPEVTRVIAIDLDAARLAMARHNAGLYGVADRIDFVHGDVVERLSTLRGDLLVLDPPWGGRGYDRERVTLDELGMDVRAALARFRGPVVLKLPRSFDVATLGEGWAVEPLVDERGILKMIVARRGAREES